jgi:4-hydroxy-tetrahydrodipicolinate reductase
VLRAANTSLGVALARRPGRAGGARARPRLGHRDRRDAPPDEGRRAVRHRAALGEAAARGAAASDSTGSERGRDGTGLKRAAGAIGFAALRGGTVAGDHDVMFLGPEERLILSHRAESRAIFARGALAAARFLVGKPPASTRCAT